MSGEFSKIYTQKKIINLCIETAKKTNTLVQEIDNLVLKIEKDFNVSTLIEQNAKNQKLAIASNVLNMAAAPACFIPFCGSIVAVAVLGVAKYIAPANTSVNLGANFIAAMSRQNINTLDENNNLSIATLTGKALPEYGYLNTSISRFVWIYGESIDSAINLTRDGLRVGNFIGSPSILSNETALNSMKIFNDKIISCSEITLSGIKNNKHSLLPIFFYKLCSNLDLKGHGTTLMNSEDLKLDCSKTKEVWVDVAEAKKMLSGIPIKDKNEILSQLAKQTYGSKFRKYAREKCFSIDIYENILGNKSAATPIYMEKLKLFAYRQRYSEALKNIVRVNFLKNIQKYSKNKKIFHDLFYKTSYFSEITIHDCSSEYHSPITTYDQYRRRIIYSFYAFHQILKLHLGTYILTSLPSFGSDPDVDRRVCFALVDALATAWWATSRAFICIEKQNLEINKYLKLLLIENRTLKELPYINDYFNGKTACIHLFAHKQINDNITNLAVLQNDWQNKLKNIEELSNLFNLTKKFSVNDLMPGNRTHLIIGLNDIINNQVKDLYAGMHIINDENFQKCLEESNKIVKQRGINYNKDFSKRYNNLYSIKDKKDKLNSKTLVKKPCKTTSELYDDFLKEVRNVQMGVIINIEEQNVLNQSEYNRAVARALKRLSELIPKLIFPNKTGTISNEMLLSDSSTIVYQKDKSLKQESIVYPNPKLK